MLLNSTSGLKYNRLSHSSYHLFKSWRLFEGDAVVHIKRDICSDLDCSHNLAYVHRHKGDCRWCGRGDWRHLPVSGSLRDLRDIQLCVVEELQAHWGLPPSLRHNKGQNVSEL